MKLVKDILLTIIMIPFILLGLGLTILFGVVHFTMWWYRRLKTKKNDAINRDIKNFFKNDSSPQPPRENYE
jgi:predicted membrane protein